MNIDFGTLNDRQRDAVLATEGKVRVLAGAGSGKTRVLAYRYAYIVEELGVSPANVLCLTFTNKAAGEMRSRITKMVTEGNFSDFICTIHGFCVKVLRRDIYRLGYPPKFTIMDTEDCKTLAKEIMKETDDNETAVSLDQFLKNISYQKARTPYIHDIICPGDKIDEKMPFDRYVLQQKKMFALDFDDLKNFAIYLLDKYDDVREYWQQQFSYVMVDETQDCNASDWHIINTVGECGNIFIVGDPDQAIYEWRGSRPQMFIDFPCETDITMDENYRSTPNILDVANSIIKNNKNRLEKNLRTNTPSGKCAVHYHAKSDMEEAEWVAKQIEQLCKVKKDYSSCAVLYRSSRQSRNIEQELMKKNIGYVVWGGVAFFERKEIKDSLCYLRMLVNADDMSFKRIANVPPRKFGEISMKKLIKLADDEHQTLYTTLCNHLDEAPFNKLGELVSTIEDAKEFSHDNAISDTLDYVWRKSGLRELYNKEGDEERLQNMEELMSSILDLEKRNEGEADFTLDKYLQDVTLLTNVDLKTNDSVVKLMTIHQSKGLEFPYVFVIGLTDGIFPSSRSLRDRNRNALEEERRLMYVAVTRAENIVFLTESEGYNFSTGGDKIPSRFLAEIEDSFIEVEGNLPAELMERARALHSDMYEDRVDDGEITVGTKVKHKIFGIGEVLECNDDYCQVKFEKFTRQLRKDVLAVIS